tara:strand:+ start:451 stop:750 length:300 start_codon:yes stop_codon:yes gene_type:complete
MKIVWISLGFFFLLVSCGDVGKALRNEKIKNTDEFLVKKKGPLVLPPDYERIPAPDTIVRDNDNEKNKIKKILKAPTQEKKIDNNSTSIEKSILEKIRK